MITTEGHRPGRRHFDLGGEAEQSRPQGPWVCWCGPPRQAARWEDRDELAWTQTTENTAGKEKLPVLQTDSFSVSIRLALGAAQGHLLEEREQEHFEDSGLRGGICLYCLSPELWAMVRGTGTGG